MKRRFPLALRITLSVSAIIFVLLAAILFLVSSSQRKAIDATVLADNDQITEARSAELGQLIEKLHWQLVAFSLSDQLRSADKRKVAPFLEGISGFIPAEAVNLLFAWPDGSALTSEGDTANISDRPYFRSVISGESTFSISSPAVSKTLGLPIVVFAQAVAGKSGAPVGIVAFQVKLSKLSEIATAIKVGKTGYGWIAEQSGLVIAHRDAQAVMSLNILESAKQGYKGLEEFGKKILSSDSGRGTWADPEGTVFTTYFETVPGSPGWKLGVNQPSAEIEESADTLVAILAIIFAVSMVLAVGASILISRSILSPIRRAGAGFRALAEGEADLTITVDIERNDEIGDLASEINIFLGKLREIMSDLKGAQESLSGIGDRLGASVAGTETAMTELNGGIDAVRERGLHQASSVEESSSSVSQIARNIASLDELIANQAASITEASAAIEQMVGNIGSVTASIARMASEFVALSGASEAGKTTLAAAVERISQISAQSRSLLEANEVISSIASSTNLLAMNAAIEAAHAGEAGKGFSVVADEIRRLSETAAGQSKTIGSELTSILETIGAVVASSKESEEAFSLVARKIADTDALVKEINQAMIEQGEGSKQILEALREMNEVTAQVKNGSTEMSEGNKTVLDEMVRLRESAFDVKERIDAMAASALDIDSNVDTVSDMAQGTRDTIKRMEAAIGRFKV
jgi:methyl-accepting chemotaxis protein